MALSPDQIREFLANNPDMPEADIRAAVEGSGSTLGQLQEAMFTDPQNRWAGWTPEAVQGAWEAAPPVAQTPSVTPSAPTPVVPTTAPTPTPAPTPSKTEAIRTFLAANPTMAESGIKAAAAAQGWGVEDLQTAMLTDDQGRWSTWTPELIQEAWNNPSQQPGVGTNPYAVAPTTPTQTPTGSYNLPDISPTGGPRESTASPLDQARQQESKELLGQAARGVTEGMPGTGLEAVLTDLTGTFTLPGQVEQIAAPTPVATPESVQATQAATQQATATTAAQPGDIAAPQIEAAEAGALAPTQAAQGTVSDQAQADLLGQQELSEGATAEAVQIGEEDIPVSAEMEAAVGTMSPEALAEAATVAGVEAARIDQAKQQLRKAGLTEAEIAAFANDPAALQERLSDFTEEQRGLIGGLPTEALVSTQMEALLQGIDNGEVPAWARPALSAVEQMLARRGMTASSIGRDALMNAVIQSAMPLAQQNAQAIQGSVMQQREFMQQASLAEAQFRQQTALQNAQNVFNLDLTNLNNEQQARLSNSQFMQTVTLTNANNRQQTAIQNASNLAALDLATLDANTRLAAQNAQAFLQMDMANLSNAQQAVLVDTQFEQQRLLTNTAAQNAARQFNASSQAQTDQFMASLAANISQFNASQTNAMSQFNASEANRQAAVNAGNQLQAEQFNSQLKTQVDQFNAQTELQAEQWNAANRQAIEQSNVQWRRQANTADTAAQNAINQQNVQNAFGMTMQAQAALWQELRDQATFDMQAYENRQDREAQLYATAIGNESAASNNYDHTNHLVNLARAFFGG